MSQTKHESSPRDDAFHQEVPPQDVGQKDVSFAQNLMMIAIETLGLLKSSVDLIVLELLLALKAIPKIIAVSFSLIFFLALAWISLSVWLSWLAYVYFTSVGAGLFCFLFVQLVVIAILMVMLKRYKRALSLPNSRNQAKEIVEVFNDAFKTSKAQENGRD